MDSRQLRALVKVARELGLARMRVEENGKSCEFEFAPEPPPTAAHAELPPRQFPTKHDREMQRIRSAYGSGGWVPEVKTNA